MRSSLPARRGISRSGIEHTFARVSKRGIGGRGIRRGRFPSTAEFINRCIARSIAALSCEDGISELVVLTAARPVRAEQRRAGPSSHFLSNMNTDLHKLRQQ